MSFYNAYLLIVFSTVLISAHLCTTKTSIYDFLIKDIAGRPVNLSNFRGKTLLIVNTASQCGFTDSHLKALNWIHNAMQEAGKPFEILAFPCNDFGGQEPWNPDQIMKFVRSHYNWQFPLMEKVAIMGDNPHPLWQYITETTSIVPTWNFQKYLFDSRGNFVNAWDARTSVESIFEDINVVVEGSEDADKNKAEL